MICRELLLIFFIVNQKKSMTSFSWLVNCSDNGLYIKIRNYKLLSRWINYNYQHPYSVFFSTLFRLVLLSINHRHICMKFVFEIVLSGFDMCTHTHKKKCILFLFFSFFFFSLHHDKHRWHVKMKERTRKCKLFALLDIV